MFTGEEINVLFFFLNERGHTFSVILTKALSFKILKWGYFGNSNIH